MSDEAYIERAIALAERGRGMVSPNPMVGAVVVDPGGRIVGEGWHEGAGLPHAEVVALEQAGEAARGATLYTSLEPCSHFGRTPPCVQAIVSGGIARVVAAVRDPNPVVDGRGFQELRAAGVEVRDGVLAAEAIRQNEAFAKHVRTGLPFVVWKMAASLDGKVAARDGSSRWITGEAARADVHRLRAWSDAIVVGARTAIVDDPSLTVRQPGYRGRPPLRVLVDARGRVPATGDLFDGSAPTLVATTEIAPQERRTEWALAGAEVVVHEPEGEGVPLGALAADLGKRDVQGVLLEGGPTLAFAAVEEGLVDRVIVYLAPKLIGGVEAPTVLGGRGFAPIANAVPLTIRSFDLLGPDLKVEADVHRDR
ncbi:MAG TPA: bifunctional diaminohydroxyphosphoribosylaminopyrimidine deaminase/5-amino-6-(5-phosphoribosylamino)uracil reductase RibD [Actinomycetota bacterium]|nr:bifunctional diaminohydroxyphosphoribosylaminopyrimidine deaminase/5-amino-6-(5-phosphoribosylamino)uracil reductase RibD [Actinomycetota bacterium]